MEPSLLDTSGEVSTGKEVAVPVCDAAARSDADAGDSRAQPLAAAPASRDVHSGLLLPR